MYFHIHIWTWINWSIKKRNGVEETTYHRHHHRKNSTTKTQKHKNTTHPTAPPQKHNYENTKALHKTTATPAERCKNTAKKT